MSNTPNSATELVRGIREIQRMREEISLVVTTIVRLSKISIFDWAHARGVGANILIKGEGGESAWSLEVESSMDGRGFFWSLKYLYSVEDAAEVIIEGGSYFEPPASWIVSMHNDLPYLVDEMEKRFSPDLHPFRMALGSE